VVKQILYLRRPAMTRTLVSPAQNASLMTFMLGAAYGVHLTCPWSYHFQRWADMSNRVARRWVEVET
jgi:hypothetical protein